MTKLNKHESVLGLNTFQRVFQLIVPLSVLLVLSFDAFGASRPRNRGLLMTVESLKQTNKIAHSILSGPNIFIPKGTSPHPTMKPGPFKATISGVVRVPIRGDYFFSLSGVNSTQFFFDEKKLLEIGPAGEPEKTPLIPLNKGYVDFKLILEGDSSVSDSYVRLSWGDIETPLAPFAYRTIGFNAASEVRSSVKQQMLINSGRSQFELLRCFKCHSDKNGKYVNFNNELDAPEFTGIGSRRNVSWFISWLKDPKAIRANARMPKMFHGVGQDSDIKAVAAYLGSLKDTGLSKSEIPEISGEPDVGGQLFDKLLCSACHEKPGGDDIYIDPDNERFSLSHVNAKFAKGALKQFLLQPSKHYKSIRMPEFRLTDTEANNLTAFLRSNHEGINDSEINISNNLVEKGRGIVSQAGCISCHTGPADNSLSSPSFMDLKKLASYDSHCIDTQAPVNKTAVHYQLNEQQRESIIAFLQSESDYLGGNSPYSQIDLTLENLQCAHCHGTYEGFPSLALMQGKLNPTWAKKFIAGKTGYHTRPWLEARMPGFEFYADDLASGMAVFNGFSPDGANKPNIEPDKAEIGKNLVSAAGGFACITCHSVGDTKATAVFEAPGINLAYSGERLQEEYFTRWLLHPLKVDRSSKMPVYFDKGKSPLEKYFNGDANKQVDAIWHYVLMGNDMPAPVAESKSADSVADEFE